MLLTLPRSTNSPTSDRSRLSRSIRCLALAAAMAVPSGWASIASAQDAAPAADATAQPANPALLKSVNSFWHYGKIGRYDLANAEGKKILESGAQPREVLEAFESVASEPRGGIGQADNLDTWMQRWIAVEAMRDVATQLVKVQYQGYTARRAAPQFIDQNIQRLNSNERAYANALSRLRESGELSVPILVDYLRNPGKVQYHASIRRALRDLGKNSLAPLCAATEMKDADTLAIVVTILGDLGYDQAMPYLARLAEASDTNATVKSAAAAAMAKVGGGSSTGAKAGDLFFDLANRYYYEKANVVIDNRNAVAFVWYWTEDKGLTKLDVPPAIYNELMTMRSCEYSLKLGTPEADAQSLWLAANYKREVQLPEGATDPTRAEGQPKADFYGKATGATYLNNALSRTLKDKDSAVAVNIIKSLHPIAGETTALPNDRNGPLVDALMFPDRIVRFESAFALASALPQSPFKGQDRVVPLLAEALAQTGQPTVIVVKKDMGAANTMVESLRKEAEFAAAGAANADDVVTAAVKIPAVDVIIIDEDLGESEIDRLSVLANSNPKLSGAARLIVTKTTASAYESRKVGDPLLSTTQATDVAGLKTAVQDARKKAGSLPLDAESATKYATQAGDLLAKLAVSRGQVLDLNAAKSTLLAGLSDPRADIVKLAGNVLGLVNDKDAQVGLFTVGTDEKTAEDLKISLLKSLATSARFFGNKLEGPQTTAIQTMAGSGASLELRNAAAEALGALNVSPETAKKLIVEQARF